MDIQINLLPWRDRLKTREKRVFGLLCLISILLTLALLLNVHYYFFKKIQTQKEKNYYWKNKIKQRESVERECDRLQMEIKAMENIPPLYVPTLLENLASIIPETVKVTSLIALKQQIYIEGRTQQHSEVMRLMHNMQACHWLVAPELDSTQLDEKNKQTTFNLHATIVSP